MADRTLSVKIAGDATSLERAFAKSGQSAEVFSKHVSGATRSVDDHVHATGRMRTAFGSVWARGAEGFAAIAGFEGIKRGVESVTEAYKTHQVSEAQLRTQIKASGLSWKANREEVDKVIERQARLSGIEVPQLTGAYTTLLRATSDVHKSNQLLSLSTDIARAKNLDASKAALLVGKVAEGNTSALTRYGIVLKPTTKAVDALASAHGTVTVQQRHAAVAADKQASAQKALGELQKRFAGQAKAYGDTQQGAADRLRVAWDEVKVQLGAKLAPVLTSTFKKLATFINQMEDGEGAGGKFADKLKDIGHEIKDVGGFLKDHIGLVKLAAETWLAYKAAAKAAAVWSKVAGLNAVTAGTQTVAGATAAEASVGASAAGGTLRGAAASRGAQALAGAKNLAGGAATGLAIGGGIKAIQDAIHGASSSDLGLLNQYAKAIERVAKAGDAGGMRKLAGQLRDVARANSDTTKGDHLKGFADALDQTARSGGKDLSSLKAAFGAMGKSTGGDLNKASDAVRGFRSTAHNELNTKLHKTLDDMDGRFQIAQMGTGDKMKYISRAVRENMGEVKRHLDRDSRDGQDAIAAHFDGATGAIRHQMGVGAATTQKQMRAIRSDLADKSADGKQALATNFEHAADAIRTQMAAGEISTKKGMSAIRGYLASELKLYGFSISEARNIGKGNSFIGGPEEGTRGPGHAKGGRITRDGGGWIGAPGMVGTDTVPAMLAPGEAVLNRHQQAVVEGILGNGFLDKLFATVDRPHYLAKGGRVQNFAKGGGVAGAVAAANQLERAHFPYRWGGGHQATPAPFGPVDCSGAVSYVLQHAGVNIPTMTSGQLAHAGKAGPGALTVYANPEHTIMRIGSRFFGTSQSNPGGGAGWIDPAPSGSYLSRFSVRHFDGTGGGFGVNIKAPVVRGGGAVGRIVQGALSMATNAANRLGTNAIGSMGLGTGNTNNPGIGGTAAQNMTLGQQMAARRGWTGPQWNALRALWTRESGWNANARNPSSGAAGIPQDITGNMHGGARGQIAWGLNYIAGRYGSPVKALAHENAFNWYARGGRVKRLTRAARRSGHTGASRAARGSEQAAINASLALTTATANAVHSDRAAANAAAGLQHYGALVGDLNLPVRLTGSDTDILDAAAALSAETKGTADDVAAARDAVKYWNAQLKKAKKSGKASRITAATQGLASAKSAFGELTSTGAGDAGADGTGGDPNQPLIDALAQVAQLEQQRIELQTEANANQAKLLTLAQTQPGQMMAAIVAAVNGGIGGRVGLGFQSVGYAGQVART